MPCGRHSSYCRSILCCGTCPRAASHARRATKILFWVIVVMGGLLVAHTTAWAIYKRHGWKLPRLLPFPRLEVYFAMFMLAPLATCAGRACCTSHAVSLLYPVVTAARHYMPPWQTLSAHVPMPTAHIPCTSEPARSCVCATIRIWLRCPVGGQHAKQMHCSVDNEEVLSPAVQTFALRHASQSLWLRGSPAS